MKVKKHTDQKQHSDFNQLVFDNIINISPGNIYWKNKEGVLVGCNLQNAKNLGFKDVKSIVGKSDFDIFNYDTAMLIRRRDLKVMSSEEVLIMEEEATIEGKEYAYISSKAPIKNSSGSVIGIIGMSIDISKQKMLEKSLQEKNELLAKQNKELAKKNEELQHALGMLDLSKVDDDDVTQETEKAEAIDSNPDKKTLLLLIDDDPSVLLASSLVLENIGFKVISADRGMKGLEVLKANASIIDVILLDIMMPDIYGLDLLQKIKADDTVKSIPVYMYSGMNDQAEVEKSIKLGASGFISKTATAKQIKDMIAKHL